MLSSALNTNLRVAAPTLPIAAGSRAGAPVVSVAEDGAVSSWYDSGVRLDGVLGDVVPTKTSSMTTTDATVAVPAEAAADSASDPPSTPNTTGLTGVRPAYLWNPKGLDMSSVRSLPDELQLFKDQFVPEFINGVPAYLDGKTFQGDNGFDPWGLVALADQSPEDIKSLLTAKDRAARLRSMSPEERQEAVKWMRAAELKHARLAMLAAAGWPIAELINPLRATGGRAPSLFNGQLLENLLPVAIVFGAVAFLEANTKGTSDSVTKKVISYGEPQVGDYGWDPLAEFTEYFPTEEMQLAEIKHGRAAMMGIAGFTVQEALWGNPVIEQTPWFFGR